VVFYCSLKRAEFRVVSASAAAEPDPQVPNALSNALSSVLCSALSSAQSNAEPDPQLREAAFGEAVRYLSEGLQAQTLQESFELHLIGTIRLGQLALEFRRYPMVRRGFLQGYFIDIR